MGYDVGLAKALKERENIKSFEPTIGQVLSNSQVSISIYSGNVILTENLVELSADFCVLNGTCEVDGKTGTCSIDRTLKTGEYVKCIPTDSGQRWFIAR